MRPRATTAAICVTIAAVVSACGSDGSDEDRSAPRGSDAPSIGMRELKFEPARAELKVGQEVTWVNREAIDHNVTAESGAKFMSQAFGRGGRYRYTPREPGTIEYTCTLHPGMDGKLVVTE